MHFCKYAVDWSISGRQSLHQKVVSVWAGASHVELGRSMCLENSEPKSRPVISTYFIVFFVKSTPECAMGNLSLDSNSAKGLQRSPTKFQRSHSEISEVHGLHPIYQDRHEKDSIPNRSGQVIFSPKKAPWFTVRCPCCPLVAMIVQGRVMDRYQHWKGRLYYNTEGRWSPRIRALPCLFSQAGKDVLCLVARGEERRRWLPSFDGFLHWFVSRWNTWDFLTKIYKRIDVKCSIT